MAKFWNNLKYHEDITKKHSITKEEIQFLIELQKEMNTQDHVGQADPRYWVIRDYTKVYGKDLSSADGISIYDSNSCRNIVEVEYEFCHVDNVIETILQAFRDEEYDIDDEYIETIKLAYDMDSLVEYLEEIEEYDFCITEYQEVPKDDGMFLTHDAAIKHLKNNEYHYSEHAHTYAKTAWRNEEADMLYQILQKVDWSLLESER